MSGLTLEKALPVSQGEVTGILADFSEHRTLWSAGPGVCQGHLHKL
jgi:hypothetical protein